MSAQIELKPDFWGKESKVTNYWHISLLPLQFKNIGQISNINSQLRRILEQKEALNSLWSNMISNHSTNTTLFKTADVIFGLDFIL